MNIELTCLAASAVLCLALPLVYVAMYQKQVGFPVVSGNREDAPGPTGAAGRGLRAHRNLIENLVPFAIAVMLARAASVSNTMTIIGAELFLAARLFTRSPISSGSPASARWLTSQVSSAPL